MALRGWLILSICSVTTPETIAPAPNPTPTIWIVFSKERSRSACSISTNPSCGLSEFERFAV
ncbi:MAG: hypothetical protein KME57_36000 [Scytonema hyalinum WJT4-NPBG1]|nr:hypothetical protein [Scytonema hyalinum WJT4-NPBG1]